MTVLGIVLAGGASTRFGVDKLAADLGGRPLLHHALEAAAAVTDALVVVLAPDVPDPAIPPSMSARVTIARDAAAHRGPLAGLAAGLAAAGDRHPTALVVGGDMPSLVPAVLGLLVDALDADAMLGAVTLEADPPAVLPMAVRTPLAAAAAAALLDEDRRALRGLLDRVPSRVLPAAAWRPVDPAADTLRDIDRPDDLAR